MHTIHRLGLRNATVLLILVLLIAQSPAFADAAPEWETISPTAAGLDAAKLDALARDIRAGKYSNIHSLLIVRNGKLAREEYFAGPDEKRGMPLGTVRYDAEKAHDIRSISKSVTSVLFGILMAQDVTLNVDAPLLLYFPEHAKLASPPTHAIKVRDVLSMALGLKWDEFSYPYGDARNSESAMDDAPDRIRFILTQPVVAERGTTFAYSGGSTALLAAIIERRAKMRLDEYANKVLFTPLGIRNWEWLKYPDGTPIAASGLRLRPRDMAKIGVLYLNEGRWNDTQIVPQAWVRDSLSPQATVSDRPTGFQRYGYQWWLGNARVGDANIPWSAGVGYGGQRLLLVPSMNLVAVLTAGLYGDPKQTDITFEILLDRVLPAVGDRPGTATAVTHR